MRPSLAVLPDVLHPGAARPSASAARSASAANDDHADPASEPLQRAALRLWAAHGLGAARHAHRHCEQAYFSGEREAYRWWLEVTRVLDRMLAAEMPLEAAPPAWTGAIPLG